MASPQETGVGKVVLVGAGPGDPGLITLRGVQCLGRADVVLYDYLANPLILEHANASAELLCVGKHGAQSVWSQDEINERLASEALAGKQVVRLKGGDPSIFARAAEESEYLVSKGIPFEIVPGITAATAAASYAGIPITHRDFASTVALVTGRENAEKEASHLDFDALARFPGTLVIYMGVTSVRTWARALIDSGKPSDTPAAIIRRCSFPDQKTLVCTLGEVEQHLTPRSKFPPPVLVIIGDVVSQRAGLTWYESRPLFGTTVLVTRPAHQEQGLSGPLTELGAHVVRQPAISIGPPPSWEQVDDVISRCSQFDWIVFSSANGVHYFLNRLRDVGRDLRLLGQSKVAAVGPATAEELDRRGLRNDAQPVEYRAEALAELLSHEADGKRFLLVRASRGREVLAEQLCQAGGLVEQVVAYESQDVKQPDPTVAELFSRQSIDWVTVTSSAIARSLAAMFGDGLKQCRLVSISPVTSSTLRELGFPPTAEAREYTMPGVIRAIIDATAE